MKNFVLSTVVLAFAGVSISQATISNVPTSHPFLQDTVKKDTVTTPVDTTKKELNDFVAVGYANAKQDSVPQEQAPAPAPAQQDSKTEVKLEELPEAVKKTLTADVFQEWVPSAAYKVNSEGKEYFLIDVKKGEELRNIKIAEDGSVVN